MYLLLAILGLFKLYPIKLSRKYRELPYPFCPYYFMIFPIVSIQQQRGPFDNVSANVMSHCHSESILLTLGVVQPLDFNRCVLTIIEDSLKFFTYCGVKVTLSRNHTSDFVPWATVCCDAVCSYDPGQAGRGSSHLL